MDFGSHFTYLPVMEFTQARDGTRTNMVNSRTEIPAIIVTPRSITEKVDSEQKYDDIPIKREDIKYELIIPEETINCSHEELMSHINALPNSSIVTNQDTRIDVELVISDHCYSSRNINSWSMPEDRRPNRKDQLKWKARKNKVNKARREKYAAAMRKRKNLSEDDRKSGRKQKNSDYYHSNAEEINAKRRETYVMSREEICARKRMKYIMNRDEILAKRKKEYWSNLEQKRKVGAAKKCTEVEESALEIGLYKWYVQKQSIGHSVSVSMLKEKAVLFNEMLGGPADFKASNGLLNRFKKRHSIREFSIRNGKSSEESSSIEFINKFAKFVTSSEINSEYIYNADETSLKWKMVPNKTIETALTDEAGNKKIQEDRLTIMVCGNASGTHKIPLLIIGKSKKPRCFDNIATLPVIYKSQKNAWIDKDLFSEWYREIFLPAIEQKHGSNAKCILLIDNSPFHPPAEILNSTSALCTVNFLSPAVNSLIQPVRGIIENLTNIYKRTLLRNIILQNDLPEIVRFLSSWNIVNCCNAIAHAWDSVTETSMKKAWNFFFQVSIPLDNQISEPQMLLNLLKQLPNGDETTMEETVQWLLDEQIDPGWKIMSDKEILFGPGAAHNDEPEIVENEINDCPVIAEDALRGIEKFERWYQSRSECSPEDLILLQHFREFAVREVLTEKLKRTL